MKLFLFVILQTLLHTICSEDIDYPASKDLMEKCRGSASEFSSFKIINFYLYLFCKHRGKCLCGCRGSGNL